MKIVRLHIDGFGHFADRELGPFDAPVTVIEGLNEAGKSTLLAFIRTVLFGWPAQKRSDHYPPLRGGRHGGRIELAGEGGRYLVERWEDTHGLHLVLTLPDGTQTSDPGVLASLLGNASKSMFEEVFAFDVDVLRGLKGSASGDIFQAGTGARALPRALAAIEKERGALFKKGGEKQTVAVLLRELSAVQHQLNEVEGQAGEYGRLTTRAAELDEEITTAERDSQAVDAQHQRAVRMRQGWEAWVRSRQLASQIAALPDVSAFPEDGVARLGAAEAAVAAAHKAVDGANDALERWRAEAANPIPDEPLLAESVAITALKDQLAWYRDRAETLPRRRAEAESARIELEAALRDLGPGWDAPRVLASDTSVAVQHEIQEHHRALDAATSATTAAAADEQRTARSVADAADGAASDRARLDALPKPAYDRAALRERRDALRACRTRAAEYTQSQSDVTNLEWQAASLSPTVPAPVSRRPLLTRWFVIAGFALAALVVLAIGANSTIAGAIIATAVEALLFAGAVLVWRRMKTTPAPALPADPLANQLDDARQRRQQALDALASAAHPFGLQTPASAELDMIDARLDATAEALNVYEAATQALTAALDARRRAGAEHQAAVEALQRTREHLRAITEGWHAWLDDHGLDRGLQPDLVALLLQKIEQARILVNNLDGKRHRGQTIADDIAGYEQQLQMLGARLEIAIPAETSAAVIAAVSNLATRHTDAAKAAGDRKRAQSELLRAQEYLAQQSRALDSAAARVVALMAAAHVESPEQFHALAAALAERRSLEARLAGCNTELATLSGPGAALERFTADLAAVTLPEIEQRVAELAETRDTARARRDDLRDERARTQQRLSQLVDGAHTSELLARRQSLAEDLRAFAQRWAELTIAKSVLERARNRWEEDRQPAVVRDAAETFATITGGRYSRIIPQLESDGLRVVEAGTDHQKDAGRLSRGAQEQLYLALRFGLIRQFGEREVRLPVIVDEVLVNFDAARGERVAEAFARLAETNQVLVFTCHDWVAAMFQRASSAQVISLGQPIEQGAAPFAPRLFAEIS